MLVKGQSVRKLTRRHGEQVVVHPMTWIIHLSWRSRWLESSVETILEWEIRTLVFRSKIDTSLHCRYCRHLRCFLFRLRREIKDIIFNVSFRKRIPDGRRMTFSKA